MTKLQQSDFTTDPEESRRLIATAELDDESTYKVEINLVPDGMIVYVHGAPTRLRASHIGLGKAGQLLKKNPKAVNKQAVLDKMIERAVEEANKLLTKIENKNE